jgi:HK97 gp10 family phage protein
MAKTFRIEGLSDIDRALSELPKATSRNVMRRAGIKALEPMAEAARDAAPVNNQDLKDSIAVSTRAAGYARRRGRKQNEVEVYMGPAGIGQAAPPQGSLQEFGTSRHSPQPFMRPAWDGGKQDLADTVGGELWTEIEKAAARQARKQARLLAQTGG